MDSNHRSRRRQIYSLLPLATREIPRAYREEVWWAIGDSNPGPIGYEPTALTTELMAHAEPSSERQDEF